MCDNLCTDDSGLERGHEWIERGRCLQCLDPDLGHHDSQRQAGEELDPPLPGDAVSRRVLCEQSQAPSCEG